MNPRHILQLLLLLITFVLASSPFLWRHGNPKLTEYRYESEVGEHIGAGGTGHYTPAQATFTLVGSLAEISVSVQSKEGYWLLKFAAPKGEKLHTGYYERVEPSSFRHNELPCLAVSSNGAECNEFSGDFTINQLVTDSLGAVTVFDAVFTQRCESTTAPPLRGSIKYNVPSLATS